jgi:CSLREA domain-containing protein
VDRLLAGTAALIAALVLPTAARAADLHVTSTTDTPVGESCADPAHCSLRQAITAANATGATDAVLISAGTYPLTNGELTVSAPATIQREGTGAVVVDAGGRSRVFRLTANTTLSGFTVTGGRYVGAPDETARGGAIVSDHDVVMDHMVVSDSSVTAHHGDLDVASATGGGAYVHGQATISDSSFTGNVAAGPTWEPVTGGGLAIGTSGEVRLERVLVRDNEVTAGDSAASGGGLSVGAATIELDGSVVEGNHATVNGIEPGIALAAGMELDGTTVTIDDTRVTGNVAQGPSGFAGGAVTRTTGTVVVSHSTIDGNEVLAEDPSGGAYGGGLVVSGSGSSLLSMRNSTVYGNRLTTTGGAPSFGGGIAFVSPGTASLLGSTVTANVAGNGRSSGGGLVSLGGFAVTLAGSIVSGNAQVTGGDCSVATLASTGGNVVNPGTCPYAPAAGDVATTAPGIGALGDHGGSTPTALPIVGSPALDRYAPTSGACATLTTDQRGVGRPQLGGCDAGAVELEVAPTPSGGGGAGGTGGTATGGGTASATSEAAVAPDVPAVATPVAGPPAASTAPRACVTHRVTVRLNAGGVHFVRARVSVDGRRVTARRSGTRWTATFALAGAPGQQVAVAIQGRRPDGRLVRTRRTLTAC